MSKQYEFVIHIQDKNYVDQLIVALARQGYAPYLTDNGDVAITISADEIETLQS